MISSRSEFVNNAGVHGLSQPERKYPKRSRLGIFRGVATIGALVLIAVGLITPSAHAAPAKPKPTSSSASVVSMPPATIRVDRQDPRPTVVIQGVAKGTPVIIDWGDGNQTRHRTKCATPVALKQPFKCTVSASHSYWDEGTFTISATAGKNRLPTHNITVEPEPVAWSPPDGWVQPAGWSVLNGGATFLPCSTVNWFWDRAGEPGDRTLLRDDAQPALDVLARETGLKFVETSDRAAAQLTFSWAADPSSPDAAGRGGGRWNGNLARVTVNPTSWWTENKWRGFGVVYQPDGWYGIGNGWLIVHEVMHGLGLGHVDDQAQVMNPVSGATALGPGDLDGLHTMYLNQPCPAP